MEGKGRVNGTSSPVPQETTKLLANKNKQFYLETHAFVWEGGLCLSILLGCMRAYQNGSA